MVIRVNTTSLVSGVRFEGSEREFKAALGTFKKAVPAEHRHFNKRLGVWIVSYPGRPALEQWCDTVRERYGARIVSASVEGPDEPGTFTHGLDELLRNMIERAAALRAASA